MFIEGCTGLSRIDHVPLETNNTRDLVIFFDGTANDEGSHTNISKLHNLVTLQNRADISTTYIKGVGTGSKVIGMAMGWGVGADVREAYRYLLDNYDHDKDRITIFGFSRGAYAARILAALLYVAGIPEVKHLTAKEKETLVADIYSAYKCKKDISERRSRIRNMISKKWSKRIQYTPETVNVKFLGLWETVEALGLPNYKEDINEPNKNYADQLCNIEAASQALSLDDDRARIFTPLLLSRKHLKNKCLSNKVNNTGKIHEVWFSGAHSDVGGGYADTDISGISLNWMLDEIKSAGLDLVPNNTSVYYNFLGKTHNPESGLFSLFYRERNRNISCYTETNTSHPKECIKDEYDGDYRNTFTSLSNTLHVHQSVLDRLCIKTPENYESFWFKTEKYKDCVSCDVNHKGYIKERCKNKVKVIENKRYKSRKVTKADNYCDYSDCPKAMKSNYTGTKSCNYYDRNVSTHAQERLNNTYTKESQSITVYADIKNDKTGIYLLKNRSYYFSINEKKVKNWIDCTIKATPEKGRTTWDSNGTLSKNLINLIAKPFTYAPTSGYMELLGQVGKEQFKLGRLAQSQIPFTPKENGELILRVNEPKLLKMVYKNNFGVLKLTITTKGVDHSTSRGL